MIYSDVQFQCVQYIYRTFRKTSDNSHGNVKGISGSLTPGSMHKIFTAADVNGVNFLDIGAGDGKPIAAAVAYGASSAQGFELPENQANAFIFKAAIQFSQIAKLKIPKSSVLSLAQIVFEDII